MSSEKARELIASGALVLDVRSPDEFAANALPGAVNLPLPETTQKIEEIEPDKDRVILCHCVSRARSGMAVGRLKKLGFSRVYTTSAPIAALALFCGRHTRIAAARTSDRCEENPLTGFPF